MSNQNRDVQKEVYNTCYDLITSSKSVSQLTANVEKAMMMCSQSRIDEFHQGRLEDAGMKTFNKIDRAERQLSQLCKHNKFKK